MDGGAGFEQFDPDEEAQDDLIVSLVGLAHIVGIFFLLRCCYRRCCFFPCCCCRGRGRAALPAEAYVAEASQLQQKKRVLTSYVLWLLMGLFGVHHIYLGRLFHGVLAAWTFNLWGVGWLLDMVLIPYYVKGFNSRRTAPNAEYDGTRRRLLIEVPLLIILIVACLGGSLVYTPRILHASGVVDIDRLAAQMEVNPYELLGLSKGASLSEAKKAYHRESLRWHPDRNMGCGKDCEQKMSDITKAFEQIRKRRAPAPPDRTWRAWMQGIGEDWLAVLEGLFGDDGARPPPQEEARARRPPDDRGHSSAAEGGAEAGRGGGRRGGVGGAGGGRAQSEL